MFFWESTNLVAGTVRLTQKTLECFPCGFVPCGGGGDAIKTSRSYLSCPFGSEKFFISFLFFKTYYYNSKLLVFCQYLFSDLLDIDTSISVCYTTVALSRDGAAAARMAHNHEVPGSSPGPATKKRVGRKTGFFLGFGKASNLGPEILPQAKDRGHRFGVANEARKESRSFRRVSGGAQAMSWSRNPSYPRCKKKFVQSRRFCCQNGRSLAEVVDLVWLGIGTVFFNADSLGTKRTVSPGAAKPRF